MIKQRSIKGRRPLIVEINHENNDNDDDGAATTNGSNTPKTSSIDEINRDIQKISQVQVQVQQQKSKQNQSTISSSSQFASSTNNSIILPFNDTETEDTTWLKERSSKILIQESSSPSSYHNSVSSSTIGTNMNMDDLQTLQVQLLQPKPYP